MPRRGSRSIWRRPATRPGAVPRVGRPPPKRPLAGPFRGRSLSPLRSGRALSRPGPAALVREAGGTARGGPAHVAARLGLRGRGRAHQARRGRTLRPISAKARRPGVGGGGDRAAQSDPRLGEVSCAAPWAALGAEPAGRRRGGSFGQGSVLSRCGPQAGTWRGMRAQGRGDRGGGGSGGVAHGASGEVPGQVHRPSPERSPRTAEPLPGRSDIRAPRSRPPRQRPQIGGAAAPRARAYAAPSVFSSPRPRPAMLCSSRPAKERALSSRGLPREDRKADGADPALRVLPRRAPRPGCRAQDLGPLGAGRRQLQPLGSSPISRGPERRPSPSPEALGVCAAR